MIRFGFVSVLKASPTSSVFLCGHLGMRIFGLGADG
jgi:hypothetical protein